MNAKNDNDKQSETREARPASEGSDPYEPEAAPKDGADFRESERGYGWGV